MASIVEAARSGMGIYTPREAAFYARMNPRTLTDWFFNDHRYRAPQIEDEERVIGFLDLVEALAIRNLRFIHKISWHKIKKAVDLAKELFKTEYPFADQNHRPVLVEGELNIIHKDRPEELVAISGNYPGQVSIKPLLETWVSDIDFGPTGVARAYRAYSYGDQRIILNPNFQFGSPIVESCGYLAETLWTSALAEGSVEAVAEEYDIDVSCVEIAVRFFTNELRLAA